MNKAEIFQRKYENKIKKDIYKIFKSQKKELVNILQNEKKSYSTKWILDDVKKYFEKIASEIPDYLYTALQPLMQKVYQKAFKTYSNFLKDYDSRLIFNIDTEPCSKFINWIKELHLSQKKGSIRKTTEDEILAILEKWISEGKSYSTIWAEINRLDPFVFSQSRWELIAIQETWKAYGWANFEPARKMQDEESFILQKKWVTSHDEKVRDSHNDNANEGRIDLNKEFSWTGDMYAPSKQFRCRCTSTTKIIW